MTKSEAIEKLRAYHKCQRLQVKGIYEDCNEKLCDNCDLCYAQGNTGEHIKSIEIAIQALEKQIPKKPIIKHINTSEEATEIEYTCSVCGTNFVELTSCMEWCPYCGNKIYWSDEDGKID